MLQKEFFMSYNTLSNLKVSKSELLTIVRENKEKHDEIFAAAEQGYWVDAAEHLKKYQKDTLVALKKNYQKTVKDLKKAISKELKMVEQKKKTGYYYMNKPAPENHTDDYEGVIRRLELCAGDHLELNNNEFDSYVRNKWTWRNSFINTNTSYALSASWSSGSCLGTGSYYPMTSSWANNGSYITSRLTTF